MNRAPLLSAAAAAALEQLLLCPGQPALVFARQQRRQRLQRLAQNGGARVVQIEMADLAARAHLFSYQCRCTSGSDSHCSLTAVPIRLTITDGVLTTGCGNGRPRMARRCSSNWLMDAPFASSGRCCARAAPVR